MPKHLNSADDFEMVPIGRLKQHSRNVNHGDFGAIEESIKASGFWGALVVRRETSEILAGNHRYAVAKSLGYSELPVTWVSCDNDTSLRILLADNHTGRLGSDDPNALAELLAELAATDKGLLGTAFSGDDLDQLLSDLAGMPQSGLLADADPDAIPDDAPTRVKPGELWQLGRHKVGCLDSLKREDVCSLMGGEDPGMVWADPPYGINIVATNGYVGGDEAYDIPFGGVKPKGNVGGGAAHMAKTGKPYIADRKRTERLGSVGGAKAFGSNEVRGSDGTANLIDVGKYAPVIGDDTTDTAIQSVRLTLDLFPSAAQIWWGGNYYAEALPPSSCWIVWDKENTGNFADAELAWTNQKTAVRIFKHMWNGLMKASEKGVKRVHPTQKPVALAEWAFDKYGKLDDLIFDPFLGSGMSIIAAEKTGRRVFGLELSPEYCDVCLSRWEKATGQTAVLIEPSS